MAEITWTIRIHSFDNAKRSMGARDLKFASKSKALNALRMMGIDTSAKKIIDAQATLIGRVGRTYNVASS